jgi:hypothetical protein
MNESSLENRPAIKTLQSSKLRLAFLFLATSLVVSHIFFIRGEILYGYGRHIHLVGLILILTYFIIWRPFSPSQISTGLRGLMQLTPFFLLFGVSLFSTILHILFNGGVEAKLLFEVLIPLYFLVLGFLVALANWKKPSAVFSANIPWLFVTLASIYLSVAGQTEIYRIKSVFPSVNYSAFCLVLMYGYFLNLAFCGRVILYRLLFLGTSLLLMLAIFLSGTRSAILAMGIITLVVVHYGASKSQKFRALIISIITFLSISLYLYVADSPLLDYDFGPLLSRLTFGGIGLAIESRFDETYSEALLIYSNFPFMELLFGNMIGYPIDENISSNFVNPHNIFLSALIFWGVIPLLLFLVGMFPILNKMTRAAAFQTYSPSNAFIFVSVVSMFCYSFFSGTLTRNFGFWFLVGYLSMVSVVVLDKREK